MKLGINTGYFWRTKLTPLQKVEKLLEVGNSAIEISMGYQHYLDQNYTEEYFAAVRNFQYRSIHGFSDIRYPSKEAERIVPILLEHAKSIDAHTITLHPDRVDDFDWVSAKFGSILAYENMDWRKNFGRTLEDMEIVFEKAPDARWVFDVNHIYTWDKSMEAAGEFYQSFKARLAHYHLSGFGGTTHQCLSQTHEHIIFSGIKDDKPIILESVPENGWIEPQVEYDYVLEHLQNKN